MRMDASGQKDERHWLEEYEHGLVTAFEHHPIPSAQGVTCHMCTLPASHKVGEETNAMRHNFTAYVCCECFGRIFGPLAQEWCAGEWPESP